MKVLIIKMSSMGDIIHTLPALTDAGQAVPGIRFDWVLEESFAEIPKWHSLVNKVIPIALRRWRKEIYKTIKNKEWQNFRKALRNQEYDLIIDAQGLIKSAVIARFAKGLHCGLNWQSAREPIASLFYQKKIFIPKEQHAITRTRQLFSKAIGYQMPVNFPESGIKNFLQQHFNMPLPTNESEKYLVFIHGTSRANKCWAENNWVALAKYHFKNHPILLPWGNNEELARANRIAAKCENVKVLPKTDLFTIAKILSKASGVVAGDTGLAHLTATLDVPLVALYGPSNPERAGAYSRYAKNLSSQSSSNLDIPILQVSEALLALMNQVPNT